jgi:hypothetical protein
MNKLTPVAFASSSQWCAGFFVSHAVLVRILGVSMAEPEKGILTIDLTPYLRDTEFEAVLCVGLRESAAKNFFL